ncbi:MAG: hypothetical protein DI535_16485 [Citrobacter freundii]|nr:MAG: hypothetical protein DI535_16485 [Citrobacter freundii]
MQEKKEDDFVDIRIGQSEWREWSPEKIAAVKAAVKEHAGKRTPEEKRKIEELSIKARAMQTGESD